MRRFSPVILILYTTASVSLAVAPIRLGVPPGQNWRAVKLVNEAGALAEKGDLEGALQKADAAVRSDPTLWPAFYDRAQLLLMMRRYNEGIRDCNEVLRQESTFIPAALLRAEGNSHLRNYSEGLKELNHVIAIRPRLKYLVMAYWTWARFYATCPDNTIRSGQKAMDDALMACKMTFWNDQMALDSLACAYAELGDFDSAIRYVQKAITLEPAISPFGRRFQRQLALFQQHKPVRIQ
jgi:tetratricopeptide (TPR) repeat protein